MQKFHNFILKPLKNPLWCNMQDIHIKTWKNISTTNSQTTERKLYS